MTRENAGFEMARRLRSEGVPLGELFSFVSGLYFRGKLAYARAFATAPSGMSSSFVITACGGLVPPDTIVTLGRLRELCVGEIDAANRLYRAPLERDLRALSQSAGNHAQVVLLGSIATPKYVEPLLEVFHDRLLFPAEFVGRGDMSRGGLMLRCVQSATELNYIPVLEATRRGPRPPRLPAAAGKTQTRRD